jgi:hypothetical protein
MKLLGIAKAKPGVKKEQIAEHRREEAARAWELYTQDTIRRELRTSRPTWCGTVFECVSLDEAKTRAPVFLWYRRG